VHFASALSSSVLTEARYFRKPAHALIHADRNARSQLPAACSGWIPIGAGLGAMDFMAEACGDLSPLAADAAAGSTAWPAAAIEQAFALRWGFDDKSQGLRDVAELRMDRPYMFHPGSPATGWLSHGWAGFDGEGARSEGELASLVIPLPALAPSQSLSHQQPHRIEVRVDYRSNAKATSVHAMFDGVVLPAQRVTGARRRTLVFDIEATAARKCLVLQFVVADAGRAVARRALARPSFTIRRLQVSLRMGRGVISAPPKASAMPWAEMHPLRAAAKVFRAVVDSARGVMG